MFVDWHGLFLPPFEATTDLPWPVNEFEGHGLEGVLLTLGITRSIMFAKILMKLIFAIIDERGTGVMKLLKVIRLMQCKAGMIMLP